jgi:PIN domain nuclease of toxin-antitoxin system
VSILLDTHFVFGLAGSPDALSTHEGDFLDAYAERLVVSAVSFWEIRLKWNALRPQTGARKGPISPQHALRVISGQPVELLSLTSMHAATQLETPILHKDPFDELLLAQAQAEGLKLLSRDRMLIDHPLVVTIT